MHVRWAQRLAGNEIENAIMVNFVCFFFCPRPIIKGDSGSGLICIHNELLAIVGITTYGLDCGINNMPGVYTAIADHSSYVRSVVSNGNWFDGKRPFTYSHN